MLASHTVLSRLRSVFLLRVLSLVAVLWILSSFGSAQAQSFQTIPALNFTKTYAGDADPLPQVITVASTGANFQFFIHAASSTGGDWLSLTANPNDYYNMPNSVTVTASPDITLAAGTYSAEIIAVSRDQSQTQTIPVTLTIEGPTATFFDDLPGQLAFSMLTKGNAPPAELVPVRNAGTGTLNFTASTSTSDGASWLSLSAASGVAPFLLSVAIDPTKLPGSGLVAGTFTGQVLFKTGGDIVTIPVSVTVGPSVFRQVNALSFTKPFEGADPLPQVITMASTGTEFQFFIQAVNSTGGDWLSIDTNPNDYLQHSQRNYGDSKSGCHASCRDLLG